MSLGPAALPAKSEKIEFPQIIRDTWDTSRGYPGGSIYGITQTSDGYLWLGTDRGLVRFDGYVFRVFRQAKFGYQPIDSVFSLAGDSQGNLLIGSNGLRRLRLRNEQLEELRPLPGQPKDTLSVIYQQHSGIMLARVREGMIAYDGKSFTPLHGTLPESLPRYRLATARYGWELPPTVCSRTPIPNRISDRVTWVV